MNTVEPIRDRDTITEIKRYLIVKSSRDYILFFLGINVGLRIGDLLKLKVKDVRGGHISMREQKTNKNKKILIPRDVKKALELYTLDLEDEDFLFQSRKGVNKPITRETAYRLLKELEPKFKLDRVGTHTLRKTFGYHFYKQFNDVVALQKIFNHKDQKETLLYIGIQQDELDKKMAKFNL
ncbi:tyrosine-type recombinase/integrase [Listeria monocytogenes]|nr:site-specific integrase [Listeria monocytogenes]EEU7817177.1 tyrosine-type recombinase/integrase [Listeria monocytogenes]EHR5554114.1 tyrosine-type recombinase/integrase [Listeria monocytogenes]EHY0437260.1 tyrosine-type recombinase/integrase [Listeria monocytogenes]EJO3820795.1 tyrosine-type recombinase/integrase [Listeria monocytogenes]